eukprot:CAMPEP_0201709902 /NCGR_PEP_ID=MMETSP0578-20130828/58345_1 /ASSEMBLY_ACC=CAM_ASM_000663 /TAXON_ID=267565 /ORGANISM="Skeletonema grethea, Strain CCMP 1804" /LENGTH=852 /DNA_ID=CAMNT_0048198899 /DNA_START=101 /DNA_END=2659 /DNA_ORIENTATION=+
MMRRIYMSPRSSYILVMLHSIMLAFCSAYLTPSRYTTVHNKSAFRKRVQRSFVPAQDASHFNRGRAPMPMKTTTLSSSVLDSEMNESPFKPSNETKMQQPFQQQQFEQVLSSPDLLDPAMVLDATIGITEVIESAASAARVDVALLDDAVQISDINNYEPSSFEVSNNENDGTKEINTQQHDFLISHDDDLDLTRQIIMKHIEQIQSEAGPLQWILDDTEEDVELGENDGQNKPKTQDVLEATVASVQTATAATVSDDTVSSTSQHLPTSAAVSPTEREINTPSVSKILKYTIPAIGVWLCSPVLSMIDTASVGLLSGTAQQAALNPAVSVADYGALVVAFMYTATTNLIAAAQAQDQDDGKDADSPRTTLTLVTALKLALVVGSVFGVGLSLFGNTLIQSLIGNDSLDPAVMAAALRYVRIRCLGMPAAVVIGTAQSACLGMQDVKSPLYVLLAAAIINFCGDVLLVPNANPWLGGAAGAAWATVFSQYGALVMFWRWMTTRPKGDMQKNNGLKLNWNKVGGIFGGKKRDSVFDEEYGAKRVDVTQGIMELTGTSVEGKSRRKEFRSFLGSKSLLKGIRFQSSYESLRAKKDKPAEDLSSPKMRGFLADGKLNFRDYLSVSKIDVPTAKEFAPFVIPVTTTSIGRISGYVAMSHVASSTLGTFDMAAHQIIFSIFCCLTPIVDALSQVAQSFVPSIHGIKAKTEARANALRKTINNFRKVGAMFGLLLVSLVSMIPLISQWFTSDPLVMQKVNGAIPGVSLFLIVNGLMCAGEGSLLGQKDLVFLRNSYALFFFTVPAYMLRLKYRALAGLQTVGIGTMWAAFATYNVIRTTIWHVRLAQLQRRTNRQIEE